MHNIKNSFLLDAIKNQNNNGYLLYHAPRYQLLLNLIFKYSNNAEKILDIGRSPFSDIAFGATKINIDTLGFESDGKTSTGFNYEFDLNLTQYVNLWRKDLPKYKIIIFSEVIEHLYTSPIFVLNFLKSLLDEDGYIFIQTPNAVVLHKRLQMIAGRNPFNLISEQKDNPAHFREYTARELINYFKSAKLSLINMTYENYFDYRFTNHANGIYECKSYYKMINYLYDLLPKSLTPGLCCIIQNMKD